MKEKIVEANCDASALEELSGYTIQGVRGCCDASGESTKHRVETNTIYMLRK